MAHQQSHPSNYSSTSRSLHSQVHDAVSVTRDKFSTAISAIQKPGTRNGLKDSWDSLVKVMFAPCAGDIGGVPRDEMMSTPPRSSANRSGSRAGSVNRGTALTTDAWGASVPFEVSASQQDQSPLQGPSFLSASHDIPMQSSPQHYPLQQQRAQTPRDQRKARSRAKLRQLGAQHQLAGGFPGESLADTARPISHKAEELVQEDEVDFDDGISAISSHTLEEIERRRLIKEKKNVVRLHPMDFSQIIEETEFKYEHGGLDLVEEEDEEHTEVVFGEPFYEEEVSKQYPTQELAATSDFNRVTSNRTHQTQNTTITDESHEFEDMYRRHEAMYWTDQDQVANSERSDHSKRLGRQTRTSDRTSSIEERARRLRELSRSRSRSDGTGSSNISGTSSLASGQHPHDTMPVYSSDLFPRRKKSGSSAGGSGYRNPPRSQQHDEFVRGSRTPGSEMEESDPFGSLDYGEI